MEVAVWLGADRVLRKAGDSDDTMSPVHRGRQGTASAGHEAHGLCMHGRKGYSLLPFLIKTTDKLLFSKERNCCREKLKDYDL